MKRLFAIILAFSFCLTLCTPAFAAERGDLRKTIITEAKRYDKTYQAVYEQLAAQDALEMLDDFMSILSPNRADAITANRGDDDEIPNIKAVYGGSVQYVYQSGYETKEVSVECMDYNNTYYYVLNPTTTSVSAKSILLTILGYVPYLSYALSLAQEIQAIINQSARNDIYYAGGYGQITTIYNRTTQESSSVVTGWHSHPWINVDVYRPRDVQFTAFPYHNPFE